MADDVITGCAPTDRPTGQRIAIIGSGITGLSSAWLLKDSHEIRVFEAEERTGGHSNTVITPQGDAVDTGFIVFNDRTYPNLCALFDHLDVPAIESDMSFAVSLNDGAFEYSGSGLKGLFGQRVNLFSPRFHRLVGDLYRFYRQAPKCYAAGYMKGLSLGDYLERHGYKTDFAERHLLPMGAAIWSSSVKAMLAFPAETFVRFYVNHGLFELNFANRPKWRTVQGGSRAYVEKMTQGFRDRITTGDPVVRVIRKETHAEVRTEKGVVFIADQVVFACHSDQALTLLDAPSPREHSVLSRLDYQDNIAVLHTDESLMPKRKGLWSSWNYMGQTPARWGGAPTASLTYWMNRLQQLPDYRPYFVSLNPLQDPEPSKEIARFSYSHPVFNTEALKAQAKLPYLQGRNRSWFCGAYAGFGFHEDGIAAGLMVAEQVGGVTRPWQIEEMSSAATTTQAIPDAQDCAELSAEPAELSQVPAAE